MSITEAANFAGAIASLVLAIVAIWLSIVFYQLSNDVSEQTREAARDIRAGVERLDGVFQTFYRDTFGLMKDTYADMRRHVWPSEVTGDDETAQRTETALAELRSEVADRIASVLNEQGSVDKRLAELRELIGTTMERSRAIEAESQDSVLRQALLRVLAAAGTMKATDLATQMYEYGHRTRDVLRMLEQLRSEGVVVARPSDGSIEPFTDLTFAGPQPRASMHAGDTPRDGSSHPRASLRRTTPPE